MIKVLGLALYGPLAASHRYRLGQYVSGLAEFGIELRVTGLLGDDYLRSRFQGGALPVRSLLNAGMLRVRKLLDYSEYDLALVYAELFPLLPAGLERMLLRKPYIYDFDDAFQLKYRGGRMAWARPLLGDKVDTLIKGAQAVTAGNRLLRDYAASLNPRSHLLPTAVDTARYLPCHVHDDASFTVGWIGSPSTAPFLNELVEPLSALGREGKVRLIVVGGKAPVVPNVCVEQIDWQEESEIDWINRFDVGVMPLPDSDWARGKCAFKLIQYMACGAPVIASPVGANNDVVGADCGLLAATPAQWLDALRSLRDQPAQRVAMGDAGRRRVEAHYSLQRNLPVLAEIILDAVARGKG